MNNRPILQMENINKTFPGGVAANQDANLTVMKGEIHAIVGENGAGKSTLMSILYGGNQPDSGRILMNSEEVSIPNPRVSKKYGIGMVHQHFMLVPTFTVLENIILGYEPKKNAVFVDTKEAERKVMEICDRYHLNVPLHCLVEDVSVGVRERVEIIKAIYRGAEILILDEPTAVLTPLEVEDLFKICREMVNKDKTILFISHKLKEVLSLSDRVTVMRSGRTMETIDTSQTNETDLACLIVGRERLWQVGARKEITEKPTIMEVKNLSVLNAQHSLAVKNVSFEVKAGEILGVAGVEGNGQTELMQALAGLVPVEEGDMIYNGESLLKSSTAQMRADGIRHIPEDRMTTGASLQASIKENLIIDSSDRKPFLSTAGFLDWKKVWAHTSELIDSYGVVAQGPDTIVGNLSGGNIQKVVVARELSGRHSCLLVLHPTRGLDIGAAEFIYRQILASRDQMKAVLLVTADLDELFLLSDRILVLYEGSVVGEFLPDAVSPEELGLYMTGAKTMFSNSEKTI
jgi:general nucleoside transport system ATP-binding protein